MKVLLNLREALRALRANKLRSVLTTLGIIFGVSSVIIMVAVGSGTQRRIQEEIESLGTNMLQVFPGAARSAGVRLGAGSRPTLTDDDARAIANEVQNIVAAAPQVRGRVQIVAGNLNWATNVTGTTEAFFAAREWAISSGRSFEAEEVEMGRKVVVLGATVARRLFPDGDAIDRTIRVNHLTFRVVGLLEGKGQTIEGADMDDTALMPLITARNYLIGRALGSPRSVASVLVRGEENSDLGAVAGEIRDILRQRHRLLPEQEDDFQIQDMSEVMNVMQASSNALTTLLAAVASISLLVGGIGIMNIMLVSVTERTREIGIRSAIGARPGDLLSQFLVEAVTLSLIGAVIGVLLGVAGASIAEEMFSVRTALTIEPILLASGFAALTGIVFGFYPALKASRLQPIEALRHD
ncbi:MAG: ABC transporter permease [Beijerinckiaceae bacterium]|nr:ABC transporter permease [Beijerinckiaceae bacterium]